MKNTFLAIFLFTFMCSFGQKKDKDMPILKYVDSIVGIHVTFISWYRENDTIKITQLRIYNFVTKNYVDFYGEEIKEKFPILYRGFTIKTNLPLSSSYRRNIYYFDFINTVNFFNRSDICYHRLFNWRIQNSPWKIAT